MSAAQARPLLAALSQGLDAKLLCPIIVAGIDLSEQTNAAAQSGAGKGMIVTGDMTTKVIGQLFSVVKNGVRYLHQLTAITGQTINFIPALKVQITGGETLEFSAPKIEGFLEGNEQGWTVGMVGNLGLSFTIREAQ